MRHFLKIVSFSAFLIAYIAAPSLAATAMNADDFVDTIGVQTYMEYYVCSTPSIGSYSGYYDASAVAQNISYLGIKNIRDRLSTAWTPEIRNSLMPLDPKFALGAGNSASENLLNINKLVQDYPQVNIFAVEGPNEIDSKFQFWLNGHDASTLAGQDATELEQNWIYTNTHADSLLPHTAVYDFTTIDTNTVTARGAMRTM